MDAAHARAHDVQAAPQGNCTESPESCVAAVEKAVQQDVQQAVQQMGGRLQLTPSPPASSKQPPAGQQPPPAQQAEQSPAVAQPANKQPPAAPQQRSPAAPAVQQAQAVPAAPQSPVPQAPPAAQKASAAGSSQLTLLNRWTQAFATKVAQVTGATSQLPSK